MYFTRKLSGISGNILRNFYKEYPESIKKEWFYEEVNNRYYIQYYNSKNKRILGYSLSKEFVRAVVKTHNNSLVEFKKEGEKNMQNNTVWIVLDLSGIITKEYVVGVYKTEESAKIGLANYVIENDVHSGDIELFSQTVQG